MRAVLWKIWEYGGNRSGNTPASVGVLGFGNSAFGWQLANWQLHLPPSVSDVVLLLNYAFQLGIEGNNHHLAFCAAGLEFGFALLYTDLNGDHMCRPRFD